MTYSSAHKSREETRRTCKKKESEASSWETWKLEARVIVASRRSEERQDEVECWQGDCADWSRQKRLTERGSRSGSHRIQQYRQLDE